MHVCFVYNLFISSIFIIVLNNKTMNRLIFATFKLRSKEVIRINSSLVQNRGFSSDNKINTNMDSIKFVKLKLLITFELN